jgi:hypothetical protein
VESRLPWRAITWAVCPRPGVTPEDAFNQSFDLGGVIASGIDLGCFSIDGIDASFVGGVESSGIRHVALIVMGGVVG